MIVCHTNTQPSSMQVIDRLRAVEIRYIYTRKERYISTVAAPSLIEPGIKLPYDSQDDGHVRS
jgi:hypothetical protein